MRNLRTKGRQDYTTNKCCNIALKPHQPLDFSPEIVAGGNIQELPCGKIGFLSSLTTHIPPEMGPSLFCNLFTHIIPVEIKEEVIFFIQGFTGSND
jgi:hypothetical protein